MKYFSLVGAVALLMACNVSDKKAIDTTKGAPVQNAAAADPAKATTIQWIDSVTQDLGSITKGQVVEVSWRFKNTGTQSLTVADVRAGCGCTTPDPPKEPIAPGAEGVIKAKFNSENFSGHVSKDVYVQANNSNKNNGSDNKLTFTAEIKDN